MVDEDFKSWAVTTVRHVAKLAKKNNQAYLLKLGRNSASYTPAGMMDKSSNNQLRVEPNSDEFELGFALAFALTPAVELTDSEKDQVNRGNIIGAIKMIRERVPHISLGDAKKLTDAYKATLPKSAPFATAYQKWPPG